MKYVLIILFLECNNEHIKFTFELPSTLNWFEEKVPTFIPRGESANLVWLVCIFWLSYRFSKSKWLLQNVYRYIVKGGLPPSKLRKTFEPNSMHFRWWIGKDSYYQKIGICPQTSSEIRKATWTVRNCSELNSSKVIRRFKIPQRMARKSIDLDLKKITNEPEALHWSFLVLMTL